MASFTDRVAGRIQQRRAEFLSGLVPEPHGDVEAVLAAGVRALWHPLDLVTAGMPPDGLPPEPAAVDGSRAVRSLNSGADWLVAQALLVGPHGLRITAADTILLRGEIERPAVDRCAALLMRSIELDLALEFAQSRVGGLLLLDGSLYAELPHLLYSLAVPGREDLPLLVLRRYLDLFACCQERGIVLLGLAKSARSTVLGRAILAAAPPPLLEATAPASGQTQWRHARAAQSGWATADALEDSPGSDVIAPSPAAAGWDAQDWMPAELPADAEILHRWASGTGFCNPVLLGTASFGHRRGPMIHDPGVLAEQFPDGELSLTERRDILRRLRAAPAIGTFYVRLAPGEDALRVDALAGVFGEGEERLLGFSRRMLAPEAAAPLVRRLLRDYGGANVYNAALYVVDREVRLHAETVDRVYLSILRRQLDVPVQYDRSTRRFMR